jgi:hypothetical protein
VFQVRIPGERHENIGSREQQDGRNYGIHAENYPEKARVRKGRCGFNICLRLRGFARFESSL